MTASSAAAAAVEVQDLSHTYSGRSAPALDRLTLSVQPGEIFGLLGPNGSGKTTLFRILSTLIPTPPGHARILGRDVAVERDTVRKHIGVVFQSPSLDMQLSAEENLIHQGHLYGLRGEDLRRTVAASMAAAGLSARARDRIGTFSGGMRRRVEVAKSLLHRPSVLLMDEPSTGLDPAARIDLWRHLRALKSQGVTVLLTTHLMDEADQCSGVAVMARGRLLAQGEPAELKQRIGGDMITIRSPDAAGLANVLRERLGEGFDGAVVEDGILRLERERGHEWVPRVVEAAPGLVDSVSVAKPTLEDVFVQLTGRRLSDDSGAKQ